MSTSPAPANKHKRQHALGSHTGETYPAAVIGAVDEGRAVSGAHPARDAYRDELTHVDADGEVRMVDVSDKAATKRIAIAEGSILMHPETQTMVLADRAKKGDVLACARVAGIMASKRTSDLIPMCHPLNITKAAVDITPIPARGDGARSDGRVGFRVQATCSVSGVTGIEMEALTAASVACLTIYDMCKAVDRGMEIVDVRLLHKEGGRSGVWERAGHAATAAELCPVGANAAGTDGAGVLDVAAALAALPVPAVSFVGYQNAGKTTLVEQVIAKLTERGVRVGSIKHHGHKGFDVDEPGKDSWRHAQAGSRHVGLVSPDRWAEYADTDREMELPRLLEHYTDVDVAVIEGYKAAGIPSIAVARSGIDRMRRRDSIDLLSPSTVAVACNEAVVRDWTARLTAAAEKAGCELRLPPFLDINDPEEVTEFVYRLTMG